ncbi:Imm40 family immunity protein [Moraxella marmotae]|uniref:Imm40 family immunity protein n=1 Tax=Moraxella marmotae TaxID=3344520 RepID=UPI0035F28AD4
MLNSLLDFYAQNGVSLSEQGLKESVIQINRIDELLNLCSDLGLVILGGDMYRKTDKEFLPTYDNWYYDGDDMHQSIIEARQYIGDFREKDGIYVALTIGL